LASLRDIAVKGSAAVEQPRGHARPATLHRPARGRHAIFAEVFESGRQRTGWPTLPDGAEREIITPGRRITWKNSRRYRRRRL
jgi:hypothetical protein